VIYSNKPVADKVDRREFLQTSMATAVGTAAAGSSIVKASVTTGGPHQIAQRAFGKTGRQLPILGYGGAALIAAAGNPLSHDDRVRLVRYAYDRGIRYFDTAGNYQESQSLLGEGLKGIRDDVCLVTKVETTEPNKVRGAVENSLKELQTDYLDAILIHGTPGIEQMTVQQAMKIHGELVKLRDEGITKFIGLSAHSYFDKALALISTGGFDQCMLAYGYFPRGFNQIWSARMLELRNACVAKAYELGMGIAAMKVLAFGVLGNWSRYVVPDFDKQRLEQLPGAAIRYVLNDDRIDLLVIGMRLEEEIDANIKTLAGDVNYSLEDRSLLAEFSVKAFESEAIKKMRVD
jgi:predicted aldo/keto reductase-like oxidoreductase